MLQLMPPSGSAAVSPCVAMLSQIPVYVVAVALMRFRHGAGAGPAGHGLQLSQQTSARGFSGKGSAGGPYEVWTRHSGSCSARSNCTKQCCGCQYRQPCHRSGLVPAIGPASCCGSSRSLAERMQLFYRRLSSPSGQLLNLQLLPTTCQQRCLVAHDMWRQHQQSCQH